MSEVNKEKRTHRVIYYSPKPHVIENFAREVCKEMGKRHGMDTYYTNEVVSGLTAFIKATVKMKIDILNRRGATQEKAKNVI